jgi:hypothetical protein
VALEQRLEDVPALFGETQALAPAERLGVGQRIGGTARVVVLAMLDDGVGVSGTGSHEDSFYHSECRGAKRREATELKSAPGSYHMGWSGLVREAPPHYMLRCTI